MLIENCEILPGKADVVDLSTGYVDLWSEDDEKRRAALECFYNDYRDPIQRFLRGRGNSEENSKEFSQEAFVRFIKVVLDKKLKADRKPEVYLYKIAINVALSHKREMERLVSIEENDSGTLRSELIEGLSPLSELISNEFVERFKDFANTLPQRELQVLLIAQDCQLEITGLKSKFKSKDFVSELQNRFGKRVSPIAIKGALSQIRRKFEKWIENEFDENWKKKKKQYGRTKTEQK